jgi:hypothetical protein
MFLIQSYPTDLSKLELIQKAKVRTLGCSTAKIKNMKNSVEIPGKTFKSTPAM